MVERAAASTLSFVDPVPFAWRALLLILLVNAPWINASEVFRYFVFVMPMMRAALPQV